MPQWVVYDKRTDNLIGPFPSQDQAMTYAETELNVASWNVQRLLTPAFMPEKIHD